MSVPSVEQINRWTSELGGFDRHYGLRYLAIDDGEVRAEVSVEHHHKQPAGLVHGGVFAAIAEAISSVATGLSVMPECTAMGMSNSTSFIRPITAGTVHAVARRRHSGRTTWLWDVEITDDDGRLCALTRMTIAVRPVAAA